MSAEAEPKLMTVDRFKEVVEQELFRAIAPAAMAFYEREIASLKAREQELLERCSELLERARKAEAAEPVEVEFDDDLVEFVIASQNVLVQAASSFRTGVGKDMPATRELVDELEYAAKKVGANRLARIRKVYAQNVGREAPVVANELSRQR